MVHAEHMANAVALVSGSYYYACYCDLPFLWRWAPRCEENETPVPGNALGFLSTSRTVGFSELASPST